MTETRAYPELKGTDRVREECGKCGGRGSIMAFGHVYGGVCFDCNGAGSLSVLVRTVRARQTRERKANAEAMHRNGAWSLVWVCDCTICEGVRTFAAAQAEREAAEKAEAEAKAARIAAERAAATPVPEGREVITGEFVGWKWATGYGYNAPEVLKIIVKDDRGFKVFGSMPSSLSDELFARWYNAKAAELGDDFAARDYGPDVYLKNSKGVRVTFTATLERSRDDELFGFFKRPTKAAIA